MNNTRTLKLSFFLILSSPQCVWPASGGWTNPRCHGPPPWCVPLHWRPIIGGVWDQCHLPWPPGLTMIEYCAVPIRITRPRAGDGGSTAIPGQSSRAPFSGIITQAPHFLNHSQRRINSCYSLLNFFDPVDDNVTSQINPQPILVTLLFLFALSPDPAHLLLQILHFPIPSTLIPFEPTI